MKRWVGNDENSCVHSLGLAVVFVCSCAFEMVVFRNLSLRIRAHVHAPPRVLACLFFFTCVLTHVRVWSCVCTCVCTCMHLFVNLFSPSLDRVVVLEWRFFACLWFNKFNLFVNSFLDLLLRLDLDLDLGPARCLISVQTHGVTRSFSTFLSQGFWQELIELFSRSCFGGAATAKALLY